MPVWHLPVPFRVVEYTGPDHIVHCTNYTYTVYHTHYEDHSVYYTLTMYVCILIHTCIYGIHISKKLKSKT